MSSGILTFILFGVGIPAISFILLFMNRHNITERSVRFKYGFLHNGYESSFWFWETVIYARKCLILIVRNIDVGLSSNIAVNRLLLGSCIATPYLILQLHFKPFDKR